MNPKLRVTPKSRPTSARTGVRVAAVGAAVLSLALAGCSAAPTPAGGSAGGGALTTNLGFAGTTINRNFNPFALKPTQGTFGFQYEALFDFNILEGGKFTPWLAKKYEWADGGKKITIHLDERANWSDGSKLTADDVVFTLNYVKKNKLPPTWAFDFSKASAPDDHTVEITFDKPAYSKIDSIGGTTPVPEKIWKKKDGAKDTNPNPVGSGPYKLKQYTPQQLTFEARDNYWKQKNVPVKTVKAPIVTQASEVPKLLSGELDWSGAVVPDVKKQYIDRDPKNHHAWYPTYGGQFLFFNHTKKPFDDVHVRKALSLAVDRSQLLNVTNPGMFNTLNLTGLDSKTQGKWIADEYKDAEQPKAELTKELAEFKKAGYTKKNGKLVDGGGKQLSFSIMEVQEWGDAVQFDKVVASQLQKAGVDVEVKPIAAAQIDAKRKSGDFDVTIGGGIYYSTPYNFFKDMLYSENAGIWTNYGHYKSKKADALLKDMASANDDATIKKYSAEFEKIMVDDVPAAPLITIGVSSEYNSKNWTGWPSAKKPYAQPAPWGGGVDAMSILLNLRPAKG
ncbi:ABC transporter substrate-binding protein [Streptomyces sp. NBC_00006]|uniref:ABC transporter substrate-binding protein n=1 Tax=Streptomyces sp. NBC_00006 TaxID=2975619 RepID=UPI002253B503|nr:ABC transporter substrate-binding protein [Streptomyces sp. NBC_00006]MCX5537533.1 ABC transporter substrate-binding protein [Streptomyces sp. NBC_00006]